MRSVMRGGTPQLCRRAMILSRTGLRSREVSARTCCLVIRSTSPSMFSKTSSVAVERSRGRPQRRAIEGARG